jgi:hypothetical protein
LRRPSKVEVKVRCWVCSTAQVIWLVPLLLLFVGAKLGLSGRGPTKQISEVLLAKKTSRQQAVTPSVAGRNAAAPGEEVAGMASLRKSTGPGCEMLCDRQRTRTTSRGVAGDGV